MEHSKETYIRIFREQAEKIFTDLHNTKLPLNAKASEMNKRLKAFKDSEISQIIYNAKSISCSEKSLLDEILLITYASYIVMLEYRNDIWPYEYMSFSRRVGELWEPFCKLAFHHSVKQLKMIEPPSFQSVQSSIQADAADFIDSLPLNEKTKHELKRKYEIPWTMVDSGGINLQLDLHFEQNKKRYNCDFKSGFSSNEKGNTNRLLLVASIFNYIGQDENQIIFVRQKESENNHYLQLLKNSKYWTVYCAEECYEAIHDFTGFDLRKWLNQNAHWEEDINDGFRKHLKQSDLLKYLAW